MADIKSIAKKINRAYKTDNLIIKGDVVPKYKRLHTKNLGFSYCLYGGLPYGRIVSFDGKEHSGKTTAACLALADYQRENPDQTCVFIDVEHSLDLDFQAKMNGLQLDKLLYISPETLSGEQILDIIIELQQAEDIGMIVLDSIPALISGKELEGPIEKDFGRAGNMARPLHRFCKLMSDLVSSKGNIFIFINQVRVTGTTFTGAMIYDTPGGSAPKYYSSVKIRFGTRKFIKDEKVDLTDGTDATGFRLQFAITKNKTADIRRSGGWISYDFENGVDNIRDALEVAMAFNYIERPSNVTYIPVDLNTGAYYEDENGEQLKFVGKNKLIAYFNEHPDFRDKYVDMLSTYIQAEETTVSLLDEEELNKIKEEEERADG